jgi:hypothetical protein
MSTGREGFKRKIVRVDGINKDEQVYPVSQQYKTQVLYGLFEAYTERRVKVITFQVVKFNLNL